jgi:transketolase
LNTTAPYIHEGEIDFRFGKAIQVRDGKDVTLIYTGTIGANVIQAEKALRESGINPRVLSMHTVKPIDADAIVKSASETDAIVTVEEHNINGGLGSAVAEVLMDAGAGNIKFKRIALPDINVSKVGGQEWLHCQYGLDPDSITKQVKQLIGA